MDDFPEFMRRTANKIATSSQYTSGVEGYLFDGVEGCQMACWTCRETAESTPHVHDYDEYLLVVQGRYLVNIDGKHIPVNAGEEYLIPKGVWHGGGPIAGTRVIQAFGGRRAERVR